VRGRCATGAALENAAAMEGAERCIGHLARRIDHPDVALTTRHTPGLN